ncbi:MAG: hypothetical protein K2J70_00490 [Muribaculaceae bacterium]|nr:hypothetical protein [Muribaculaceae bacterium]
MNRIYTFGLSMVLAAGIGMSASAEEYALAGTKPANGAVVNSFSELTLFLPTWDKEKNIPLEFVFNSDSEIYSQLYISKDGTPVLSMQDIEALDSGDDVNIEGLGEVKPLIFLFSKTLTADGEYTIHVPADLLLQRTGEMEEGSSYSTAAYTSTFTIDSSTSSPLDNYIFTPASGTELGAIESISLVFPDVTSQEWNDKYPAGKFSNGAKDYAASVTLDSDNQEGHLAFIVKPMENEEPVVISKADDWTLTFDAGSIGLKDGTTNQNSIRATYIVTGGGSQTGIESIFNSNGNVTVFSIDGKKIIDNASEESLYTLGKGIYVINGKTVLVK